VSGSSSSAVLLMQVKAGQAFQAEIFKFAGSRTSSPAT
jgi:hypothetical protein